MRLLSRFLLTAVAALGLCGSATASQSTLYVTWEGRTGSTAHANGFLIFDSSTLPIVGDSVVALPDPRVIDLGITITGATGGNGTFGLADFGFLFFDTPSPLDLTKELIGQPLANGFTYGVGDFLGRGGDFNFAIPSNPSAPVASFYFELTTSGGDVLHVTSITPVPEPATVALMAIGIGIVGFAKRASGRRASMNPG